MRKWWLQDVFIIDTWKLEHLSSVAISLIKNVHVFIEKILAENKDGLLPALAYVNPMPGTCSKSNGKAISKKIWRQKTNMFLTKHLSKINL